MSARYGRNQKRRHREQIARLSRELDVAGHMLFARSEKIRKLEMRLRGAVEISLNIDREPMAMCFTANAKFNAPADIQVVSKLIDELMVMDFMGNSGARERMARNLAERFLEELPGGRYHRG